MGTGDYFLDVNGDGAVSAADTRQVTDKINGNDGTLVADWQNADNPQDATGDGHVDMQDVAAIIDFLNTHINEMNQEANIATNPKNITPPRLWKRCLGHPFGRDEDHIPFMNLDTVLILPQTFERIVQLPAHLGAEGVQVTDRGPRLFPLGLEQVVRSVEGESAVDLLPYVLEGSLRVQVE